jgi:hypothetical protein
MPKANKTTRSLKVTIPVSVDAEEGYKVAVEAVYKLATELPFEHPVEVAQMFLLTAATLCAENYNEAEKAFSDLVDDAYTQIFGEDECDGVCTECQTPKEGIDPKLLN